MKPSQRLSLVMSVALALLMESAVGVSAIPAAPGLRELPQSDGITFQAQMWGDEWLHGWETPSRYTIIQAKDGSWRYAQKDNSGKLVPSDAVVGQVQPPDTSLNLRPSTDEERGRLASRSSSAQRAFPSSGTQDVLVILIEYSDAPSTFVREDLDDLLFGVGTATGPGNMADYYEEVSYGALTLAGTTVGWMSSCWNTGPATRTLPDSSTVNRGEHDYYGDWDATDSGEWAARLVRDAVLAADATVDFSDFDNDGDGYVDSVVIVHQGDGAEEDLDLSNIWSHRWSLSSAGVGTVTADGVIIDDYCIQPETLSGDLISIGVFCHEFGHILGLPDFYDTDSSTNGCGYWELMASGSWSASGGVAGDCPSHLSAYPKWRLDWLIPYEIQDMGGSGAPLWKMSVPAVESNPFVVQLESNPNGCQCPGSPDSGAGEYFLVENRSLAGFDAGAPGAGLLITHIWESNAATRPCANYSYPNHLVQVEEADGNDSLVARASRGEPGDLWTSGTNATFNDTSTPNSTLHDGTLSGACACNIGASADLMTAGFSSTGCPAETGKSVLFYEGHGSPSSFETGEMHERAAAYDLYQAWVWAFVNDLGYTVAQSSVAPLTASVLSGYDIVIIAVPTLVFSAAELAVLRTYVGTDGRVLVSGDGNWLTSGDADDDGTWNCLDQNNWGALHQLCNWLDAADGTGLFVLGEWGSYAQWAGIFAATQPIAALFGIDFNEGLVIDPVNFDGYSQAPLVNGTVSWYTAGQAAFYASDSLTLGAAAFPVLRADAGASASVALQAAPAPTSQGARSASAAPATIVRDLTQVPQLGTPQETINPTGPVVLGAWPLYESGPAVFRVGSSGDVLADGGVYAPAFVTCAGCADVAEWVTVSEPVEAGDVLAIDPNNPLQYCKAVGPCSAFTAGVVSTTPGMSLGGAEMPGKALLALVGMVPVKACDENGPILAGDLVVVSSTPGYVMRWDGAGACSNLVGKALESLDGPYGVIRILLTR
jgi:M6 family metalloprotease-like protein